MARHPRTAVIWRLDLQLAQLALLADDPAIATECAPGAVTTCATAPPPERSGWPGRELIGLLDRHSHPVPLDLLRLAADAAHQR